MQPVVGPLRCIPYHLILGWIITGQLGPAIGALASLPPDVNSMAVDLGAVPPPVKVATHGLSLCPEIYAEDALILLKAIYLGLFWLGIPFGNFSKRCLKLGVRNIPDGTLCPYNLLGTVGLKERNGTLQLSPQIGEPPQNTWRKKQRFIPRLHTKPGSLPASQQGTAHPPQWDRPSLPDEEIAQLGIPKGNFPKPKNGGNCCPNLEPTKFGGVYKLPSMTINASATEVEYECMKVPEEAPKPCDAKISNSLLAKPSPSPSQKGIPDNTKCLGFPVQWFALFMPHKDDTI
ncbi:hypothetical protein DSO57_1001252 [Entomophthora muscae]|uniref:Uncharacterized protein n=1 Tax=Entomophthora muscae TaxID=34485 RepID=A0ACC2SMK6_9FUNG|nr:hypothetical protein DSO57_1001252 [Entomophthora muscae]